MAMKNSVAKGALQSSRTHLDSVRHQIFMDRLQLSLS
jgi:hypothetical protein